MAKLNIFRFVKCEEEPVMEFRLLYQGSLATESNATRTKQKQDIRRFLHPQIRELWKQNSWMGNPASAGANFSICDFHFAPALQKKTCSNCSLEILFLRRDAPGNLVKDGGDIDNRIKVLFDGLRMPHSREELAGDQPTPDDDPFFCLLEDDSMITEVHVITDRLFMPPIGEESPNNVYLVIRVRTDHDLARASDVRDLEALTVFTSMVLKD